MKFVCTLAVLALAMPTPALADDSSASLAAGGLVFTRQVDIRMAMEDLRISPKEVRVRYEFVNDGKADVQTVVAFPMPDIDVREFWYEPLGTTVDQSPNFMDFALMVDGKTVAATPDERAVLDGRDVTAQVKAAGLPINIAGSKLVDRIDHLSPAAKKSLAAAGLVEIDGNEAHPHWIAKTSYWWHQIFPAGKTVVIEHRYQPVTGQSLFGDAELNDQAGGSRNRKDFCIDDPTAATIRSKIAKLDRNGPNGAYLQAFTTAFVLKTANNWKGGIGRLHLTLDKLKQDNVLSLCWDGELKKTGPTTFEATRQSFAPARDIKLLVLQ
jgi:uncharacterized protein DUF4424